MSADLDRLEGASALRTWEERRGRRFALWRDLANTLSGALRQALTQGEGGLSDLLAFIQHRGACERAYIAGLKGETLLGSVADPSIKGEALANHRDPLPAPGGSSLLAKVADLQRYTAQAREGLLSSLEAMESSLQSTAAEFKQKSTTLLHEVEVGVAASLEAHTRVVEAMAAFRKASIQDPRKVVGGFLGDIWLQEHRYRVSVAALRDHMLAFTLRFCEGVEEVRRLQAWREEMVRKLVRHFCAKVFNVETAVQSIANDAMKVVAGHKFSEEESCNNLRDLEKVLLTATIPADQLPPPPPSERDGVNDSTPWPALRQLRLLGCLETPPASRLALRVGVIHERGRWFGRTPCVGILTRDQWLHCFRAPESPPAKPVGKNSASAVTSSPSSPSSLVGLKDAEPQWSIFVPNISVALISGKDRLIEIEESRRSGILGILGGTRREHLEVDSTENAQGWLDALARAGGKVRQAQPYIAMDGGKPSADAAALAAARVAAAAGTQPSLGAPQSKHVASAPPSPGCEAGLGLPPPPLASLSPSPVDASVSAALAGDVEGNSVASHAAAVCPGSADDGNVSNALSAIAAPDDASFSDAEAQATFAPATDAAPRKAAAGASNAFVGDTAPALAAAEPETVTVALSTADESITFSG